jgi:hypothetical protein
MSPRLLEFLRGLGALRLWLLMMVVAMVVTFLAMTPLSIYLHGELTRDYLITGTLTCLAAGSVVSTVTVYALAAFGRLADEQEHLRAQLFEAQKHEAIAHLASGVAHDFNSLLQTVLANTSFSSKRDWRRSRRWATRTCGSA